jgi:tRNA (guanine9-N1)-methyltransferase
VQGICHQIAQEKGISHGKLPIEEFLEMKTRKVLTIDHGKYRDCSSQMLLNE